MMEIRKNIKINCGHLQRKAIVYIRQSSPMQVLNNKESQRLQYALRYKALEYGWGEAEIIDDDLGASAAVGACRRIGFERLIASVTLGEIGIIFSREASRLSRNDKDWCHLLEVCCLFNTLIGDDEHIYDLNNIDDQLVLGIKATMSVIELKILRSRLIAGMEEKAGRGELKILPPPGYMWDGTDKVVKDPSKRVREAIMMIFNRFRMIGSIRQTFLWFHNNNIELPVNKFIGGKRTLKWQLPKQGFIQYVLKNAYYAGAYLWGQRATVKEYRDGRIVSRISSQVRPEESRVFLKDHHEGYIDWKTFEENQEMIKKNTMRLESDETVGTAREGQGILVGILRCGHCGRKLHVRYWGKKGTAARYVCNGDYNCGGKYCIAFGGSYVDRRFSKELLKAISPYGIEAGVQAAETLASRENVLKKAAIEKLRQLEYEERRAFEQYNEADPRNRLVAGELEKRWNIKLELLEKGKEELSQISNKIHIVSENERNALTRLGENFESVWESERCLPSLKKKIIRTVVEEIIVTLSEETNELTFIIHWKGGCHTLFSMLEPVSAAAQQTAEDDIDIIRKMGAHYGDNEIARVLNKLGHLTGKGNRWNESKVKSARITYSIKGQKRRSSDPEILSLGRAAKYCNVSHKTIQKLVASGLLEKKQIVRWAPWEINKTDLDSEKVQDILKRLRETGRLTIKKQAPDVQLKLFESESKKENSVD